VVERGTAAAGRAAGRLSKYASQPGLQGVAEAAGHVLGELAPAAKWRQEVLMTRLAAGATLALTLGEKHHVCKLCWLLRGCCMLDVVIESSLRCSRGGYYRLLQSPPSLPCKLN
jgi:hypothetical protein